MDESAKKLLDTLHEFKTTSLNDWLQNSVFTWRWWFGVIVTIVPWILWIIFRNKRSTYRLLFAGFSGMIFAIIIDTIGVSFNLFFYRYTVLPIVHIFSPWDFTLIPISIMLLLQIKPNSFLLIKVLFFATFAGFVIEPIFHWLKIFELLKWRYTYSFFLYIILYLICYFLVKRKDYEPF